MPKQNSVVNLILNETNTIILIDIPSSTELRDTEEGQKALKDNELYDHITIGKGSNRKTASTSVQTYSKLTKSRFTDCIKIKYSTNGAFASIWDMYDTYEKGSNAELSGDENEKYIGVFNNQKAFLRFQESACVIERLLASNFYNEKLKFYKNLFGAEQSKTEGKYTYDLEILWILSNKATNKIPVTAILWNPLNSDLLAVAYGKYFFDDSVKGHVLIWNIKNPVQPERHYKFETSITAIAFSKENPNILAIGNYVGEILVVNIAKRDLHIIARTISEELISLEPIWQIYFLSRKSNFKDELIATYDDGKIILFQVNNTVHLRHQQIMNIKKADGKLKGIETIFKRQKLGIPVNENSPALVFCASPEDPTKYYIGAGDGAIHICSTNYLNRHIDMFLAHDGPVNHISFSPFCDKLFITSGFDMYTRLWCSEDISKPIFEASTSLSNVTQIAWSPHHSTTCAVIKQNKIYMWDMQRKVFRPQSITNSPTESFNTVIKFNNEGKCLVVGDVNGDVTFYLLKNMPVAPYFQENLLLIALEQNLINNQDVVKKLKEGLKIKKLIYLQDL